MLCFVREMKNIKEESIKYLSEENKKERERFSFMYLVKEKENMKENDKFNPFYNFIFV